MVHFVYPYLFWILVIPFAVFAFLVTTNKSKIDRLFDPQVLEKIRVDANNVPQVMRNVLFFIALFFMIVAMARPVIDRGEIKTPINGSKVVLAIDISGSMRSRDNYPNRLEFAKRKVKALLQEMNGDEVALVAFADNSFLAAPFTTDIVALQNILDGININPANIGSTNFTSFGEMIAFLTNDKQNKTAIVISDGGDERDLMDFESLLRKNNIKLFVLLVGSKNGSAVLDANSKPFILPNGKIAFTNRNDALGSIALQQNGAYMIASHDDKDIKELADILHRSNIIENNSSDTIRDRQELFYYPVGISLVLLLFAWSSIPVRTKK
ncbi:MAG: VWA domain-containing protein [Sulfurovaceae bacterium]|nr:VWA domain-containing protein [Sulfurovaceae bacterium]